jgi:hypothetical protein
MAESIRLPYKTLIFKHNESQKLQNSKSEPTKLSGTLVYLEGGAGLVAVLLLEVVE